MAAAPGVACPARVLAGTATDVPSLIQLDGPSQFQFGWMEC